MSLALKLVEVSGATRCDVWGSRLEGNSAHDNKVSFSPSASDWLADSVVYAKNAKEEVAANKKRSSKKTR